MAVSGEYAYVVGEDTALTVVDVSDPANPHPIGEFQTFGWAQAVQVVQGRVFIAGEYTGLEVFNVDAPTNPMPVAQYPMGTGDDAGWDLDVIGNFACLARGASGLLVFSIYEPPRIRAFTRIGNELRIDWDGTPGLKLQRSASLQNPDWTDVPDSDGQGHVRLPLGADSEFFRLITGP